MLYYWWRIQRVSWFRWSTVGDFLSYCMGVKHPFYARLPSCQQSWNINNLSRQVLFPIIDIMGSFLSYKDMLTKLESLLCKALRGIGLAELPVIFAVIAWLLALSVQLRARYQVRRGGVYRSGCRKKVDYCAVLACCCIDLALVLTGRGISRLWTGIGQSRWPNWVWGVGSVY